MKEKRINGVALEHIMRDVLEGMQDFTCDACVDSVTGELTVLSVEKPACGQSSLSALIIPFPTRTGRRKI